MSSSLSANQRAILGAMRDHDYARFYEGLSIGVAIHRYETRDGEIPGGVWVMYGGRAAPPQQALERAGFIETVRRNVPGDWWKLTELGLDRMAPKQRAPKPAREPKWWHLNCYHCEGAGLVPGYAYAGHGTTPIKCRTCGGRGTIKARNPYREAPTEYA